MNIKDYIGDGEETLNATSFTIPSICHKDCIISNADGNFLNTQNILLPRIGMLFPSEVCALAFNKNPLTALNCKVGDVIRAQTWTDVFGNMRYTYKVHSFVGESVVLEFLGPCPHKILAEHFEKHGKS